MGSSRTLQNDWQVQITEKVNLLETKMISMDNGLAGAGENIKKILEHLLKNSSGRTTPPRKKQSRRLPLSPVNDNQRSAISEIARAQRPLFEHMSPRSPSQLHSHGGGVGREGDDDETEGNNNEVVDLGDDATYIIPCTQMKRGKSNFGKGKGIVVIDSQSGGEEEDTRGRGCLMEEYEKRRPHQLEGEEDRGKKMKGTTQAGRRRLESSSIQEDDVQKTNTHTYDYSEEEEDDSDTQTLSPPRRSEKRPVAADVGEGEETIGVSGRPRNGSDRIKTKPLRSIATIPSERVPPSTQTYRRLKIPEHANSAQAIKGVGVLAKEVPETMRPRKNGVG